MVQCVFDFHGADENADDLQPLNWGVGLVCKAHFEQICDVFRQDLAGLGDDWIHDFARIEVLLRNADWVMGYLSGFGQNMTELIMAAESRMNEPKWWEYLPGSSLFGERAKIVLSDHDYMNLSRALEYYEAKCWFPTTHLLPLGILSGEDFLNYIRDGYLIRDYGAGYAHGEFTHRLQWHAIMRAISNEFQSASPHNQGWNHSALELFCKIGECRTAVGPSCGLSGDPGERSRQSSLWGYLFDVLGSGRGLHQPDEFHLRVRKETTAISQKLANHVSGYHDERRAKRSEIAAWVKDQFQRGTTTTGGDTGIVGEFSIDHGLIQPIPYHPISSVAKLTKPVPQASRQAGAPIDVETMRGLQRAGVKKVHAIVLRNATLSSSVDGVHSGVIDNLDTYDYALKARHAQGLFERGSGNWLRVGRYSQHPKLYGGSAVVKLSSDKFSRGGDLRARIANSRSRFQPVSVSRIWDHATP